MSQPSRPQARGPASRRRRDLMIDSVMPLEERCLLAPVLSISPRLAVFTPDATLPTGVNSGGVVVTLGQADAGFLTDYPFTSVTQLTPISSFGGDIVRIESGPGGVFGNDVYAISRGAGENGLPAGSDQAATTTPPIVNGAINRPGVIYRVDPATGKTSVFFDLNTVLSQIDKGATPGNSVGASTGLVNWYDMTFDPEGYFDGKPSMFVASVDRADPAKNAVYRIAPDGTFMGMFVVLADGASALKLNVNPSAILVPPPEDQTFLRGLLAGGGVSSTGGTMSALFFDANAYSPGAVITSSTLPTGVSQTGLALGPITGMTAANPDYLSRVYSTFTDFGTPAAGGIPANPGVSGVQGINGEFLINAGNGATNGFPPNANTSTDSTITDKFPFATTDFRRFEDIAFDQYGYFAQGANIGGTASTTAGSVGGLLAGGGSGSGVGQNPFGAGGVGTVIINNVLGRPTIALPPASAGDVFVSDLGTGLSVPVAIPLTTPTQTIRVPVQGPERITVTNIAGGAGVTLDVTPFGPGLGGRIVRITPGGVVRNFAENFHTSNNLDSSGFELSSLSITFSADGTTLYAADDDAIWQFKTVASLAGSTSGSLIGLNDLRSLGVPYDGQNSAVAIIDTGVDSFSSPFRGRVAPGTNVFTNGFGNDDTSIFGASTTGTGTNGGTGGAGTTGTNPAPLPSVDGHGTPVAGVVAQFVPQATIVPVNVFAPFIAFSTSTTTAGNGGAGGAAGTVVSANTNTLTSSELLYKGLNYVSTHPFVNDPIRPGQTDRVIATTMGFGSTETFDSEGVAYRHYPQIVIAFKNQMKKFRNLGIAPIAAAGQFGAPFGASSTTTGGAGGVGGTGLLTVGQANNNAENVAVGDVNGIAFPAILNEVVSVTGDYSYPFSTGPGTPPTNPPTGVVPRPFGPVLIFGNALILGGGAAIGNSSSTTGNGGTGGGTTTTGTLLSLLANADFAQYSGRILGSGNRNSTTDFAAPALNVPTFRRTFAGTATTTTTGGGGTATSPIGDPADHNTFNDGGTSLSAAEVTGAFALVASALNYWTALNVTGVTSDGYLTGPVGVHTLNFGPHGLLDLSAYNNPDGINAILQWTAIPAADSSDGLSASTPPEAIGSPDFRNFSQLSVGNAIAAIEGAVALQYLISHNDLPYIDTNNNGIITTTELQTFVDNSTKLGLPEAGAMARLLGGTARTGPDTDKSNPYGVDPTVTLYQEQPDQPDVLQRRFNFFDYAADGNLNGSVTTDQLTVLAHNLLPMPDSFVINNRQKASVDGYLLNPTAQRDYHNLLHLLPKYEFVPKSALVKYKNVSPSIFHVARGTSPYAGAFPAFTLFGGVSNSNPGSNVTNAPSTPTTTTTTTTPPTTSTTTGTTTTPTQTTKQTPVQPTTTATGVTQSGGNGAQSVLNQLTSLIQQANGTNTSSDSTSTPGVTKIPATASSSASSTALKPATGVPLIAGLTSIANPTPITTVTPPVTVAPPSTTTQQPAATPHVVKAKPAAKKKNFFQQIFG
jgi:hypothetical protein